MGLQASLYQQRNQIQDLPGQGLQNLVDYGFYNPNAAQDGVYNPANSSPLTLDQANQLAGSLDNLYTTEGVTTSGGGSPTYLNVIDKLKAQGLTPNTPAYVAAWNADPGVMAENSAFESARSAFQPYEGTKLGGLLGDSGATIGSSIIGNNPLYGNTAGTNNALTTAGTNANGFNLGLAASLFAAPALAAWAFPETFGAAAAGGAGGTSSVLGAVDPAAFSFDTAAGAGGLGSGLDAAGAITGAGGAGGFASGLGGAAAIDPELAALGGSGGLAGLAGAAGGGGGGGLSSLLSSLGSSPLSTAQLLSSGIGALSNIGGNLIASSTQQKAAQQAIAAQQGYFNTAQQNLQPYSQFGQSQFANLPGAEANYLPYINAGTNAANKITGLEGGNGTANAQTIQDTLQGLPGYQFALQQGLKTTQNSAAARGLGTSGAALKGGANYSTGLANQYYNNLLTGLQNTANTGETATSGLSGTIQNAINTGGNAAAGVGNQAVQTGANIGQNLVGSGNAQAGAAASSANSIANAVGSVPNSLLLNQLLQNQNKNTSSNFLLPDVPNLTSAFGS